jgi:hypothetical protein
MTRRSRRIAFDEEFVMQLGTKDYYRDVRRLNGEPRKQAAWYDAAKLPVLVMGGVV